MTLSKEFYKALEDIVGPENVTDSQAVIDSYSRPRPGTGFSAVIMPKDTFEVQAIVKLCNKHNISFKASSTSFGHWCDPATLNVVRVDLKRMNHIVEINEESMYAVVEPYVVTAELQAELMKRGLNVNVIGCGANSSALPYTAHAGIGHCGETTSYRERNILGVEWVTPEGEIVRMGSLGSGGEWFCGDGPGPSLRGIVCGSVAPLGGMGIFTRAATKIYPWPGPVDFDIEGVSPHYLPKEPPGNFSYGYYSFPTIEDMCEAQRKIGESEIAFQVMGFNIAMVAANMATSNPEDQKYFEEFRKQIQGRGFQVILAGNSANDLDYKKLALKQIMEKYHGKALAHLNDPRIGSGFIWRCIRVSGSIRECFRDRGWKQSGAFLGGTMMFAKEINYMENLAKVKQKYIDEGILRDDTAGYISWTHELGHLGHGEMLFRMNEDPGSFETLMDIHEAAFQIALDTNYGVPSHATGDKRHDQFGPHASNYHLWLRKIKKSFDPLGLSDTYLYISATDSDTAP